MKFLTPAWLSAPVGAITYLAAMVYFWQAPKLAPAQTPTPAHAVKAVGPSWEFSNPEADELISELKAEKKALAEREQQLNEMQLHLDNESAELSQVTQSVRVLQTDFDKAVVHAQADETANLKKLAKVYSDMAPDTAANVLGQMDDIAIVKILMFMQESETAGILESWAKKSQTDARRAAAISERLRLANSRPTAAK